MTAVNWSELNSTLFEDLVAVLLSHMNPDTERIDGAGGDGGRDCIFRSDAHLHIWQIKYFPHRLNPARKKQILRSFQTAAEHEPTTWTLVLPHDLTPHELDWFDNLASTAEFDVAWRGKTWLDAELASRSFLQRYFLQDGAHEAIALLTELNKEEAALANGVPDAVHRLKALAGRLDELDPHYRFDLALNSGQTTVSMIARYPGAARDRPVRVTFDAVIPNDEAGRQLQSQFREVMAFGNGAVELPPEVIQNLHFDAPAGFGDDTAGSTIAIGPAAVDDHFRINAELRLLESDRVRSSLPLTFHSRSSGSSGGYLRATDASESLEIVIKTDLDAKKTTAEVVFKIPAGITPHALVPVLKILRGGTNGRRYGIYDLDDQRWMIKSVTLTDELIGLDADLADFVETLARVQLATGRVFPLPTHFGPDDSAAARQADELLRGDRVRGTWTSASITLLPGGLAALLAASDAAPQFPIRVTQPDYTVTIAGEDVVLGTAQLIVETARLKDAEHLRSMGDNADEMSVEFVPGTDDSEWTTLID